MMSTPGMRRGFGYAGHHLGTIMPERSRRHCGLPRDADVISAASCPLRAWAAAQVAPALARIAGASPGEAPTRARQRGIRLNRLNLLGYGSRRAGVTARISG